MRETRRPVGRRRCQLIREVLWQKNRTFNRRVSPDCLQSGVGPKCFQSVTGKTCVVKVQLCQRCDLRQMGNGIVGHTAPGQAQYFQFLKSCETANAGVTDQCRGQIERFQVRAVLADKLQRIVADSRESQVEADDGRWVRNRPQANITDIGVGDQQGLERAQVGHVSDHDVVAQKTVGKADAFKHLPF